MFGIGIWELGIIIAVFIIAVKPQDIPKLLRKAGNLYNEWQKLSQQFSDMVQSESRKENDNTINKIQIDKEEHL